MNYFHLIKKYSYIFITLILLLSGTIYLSLNKEVKNIVTNPIKLISDLSSSDASIENTFYVDIKGAVKNPGVYEFNEGDMVIDAISSSGGLKKNALTDNINLSKKLSSEMVIYIKTVNEATATNECPSNVNQECICDSSSEILIEDNKPISSLVNINTASLEELMQVSGIGEAKALAIISYRSTNSFTKIEDIMNVSGIGESIFNKIRDYITI